MKNIFVIITLLYIALSFHSCKVKDIQSNSRPISHATWDTLLQKHVSADGWVNYKGFIEDRAAFDKYLTLLSNNHPNKKNWSKQESFAYWINAYNAFTVQLIVDNYPTKSIKDIKNGVPFVNTVWDIKFIKIEGQEYDLNNLEHGIIRPKYKDPRAHFAVNCASYSCPKLLNEAYVANRLDEQLDAQAVAFITDEKRNIIQADKVQLSKIFKWYKGDFTDKLNLIEYINQYSPVKINGDAAIEHMDYGWTLNEQ